MYQHHLVHTYWNWIKILKFLLCKKSIYCLQSKKPFRFSWFHQQLEKSSKLFKSLNIFFLHKKDTFLVQTGLLYHHTNWSTSSLYSFQCFFFKKFLQLTSDKWLHQIDAKNWQWMAKGPAELFTFKRSTFKGYDVLLR